MKNPITHRLLHAARKFGFCGERRPTSPLPKPTVTAKATKTILGETVLYCSLQEVEALGIDVTSIPVVESKWVILGDMVPLMIRFFTDGTWETDRERTRLHCSPPSEANGDMLSCRPESVCALTSSGEEGPTDEGA